MKLLLSIITRICFYSVSLLFLNVSFAQETTQKAEEFNEIPAKGYTDSNYYVNHKKSEANRQNISLQNKNKQSSHVPMTIKEQVLFLENKLLNYPEGSEKFIAISEELDVLKSKLPK